MRQEKENEKEGINVGKIRMSESEREVERKINSMS